FPPEPNGYLHIGHAKAICLDFGIASEFGGRTHLRFDDTNPAKEDTEYVDAIQADIRWLGFDWGEHLFYASDYYDRLYAIAQKLIRDDLAYVDSQSKELIRETRGSLSDAGTNSPFRDRPADESLDLLARMKAGEFAEGAHVLRAKIDMSNPNMLMRDPLLYRILHHAHDRTGDAWHIYPMYDFAHCLSDAIEGITHSICTLEFENNRELYDWVLAAAGFEEPRPHQYEMARLKLEYTVMSKRKLLQLVNEDYVDGWDDPRMPTLAGMRRRGVTPEAIRDFCDLIGVAKTNSFVDYAKFEYCLRNDLNTRAPRVMAVLDPLEVVLSNWPGDDTEWLDASLWPHDVPKEGTRKVPFSGTLLIERSDFQETPSKKYKRLSPGAEVRLRYGYIIRCDDVIKDAHGTVTQLKCSYLPATRSGQDDASRKVKGTIHWLSKAHAVKAEVRLYDRLFAVPQPGASGTDFLEQLNSSSKVVVDAFVEPSITEDAPGSHYQFERTGYFFSDPTDHAAGTPVYNRVVGLRDSWGKKRTVETPAAEAPKSPKPPKKDDGRQRPDKLSRAEQRAKTRENTPALAAAYERLQRDHGLSVEDADVLTEDLGLVAFFDAALAAHPATSSVTKWVVNEVLRETKDRSVEELPFDGAQLGRLVALVDAETISARAGKAVLEVMATDGGEPADIMKAKGLEQVSDVGAIEAIVAEVLANNPGQLEAYRDGKTKLLGFFVGQAMKATRGAAKPQLVQELVRKALAG
ncbi:MAG: glutaminyl-tRNA synthetase, partial [Myxococcota bacterium]